MCGGNSITTPARHLFGTRCAEQHGSLARVLDGAGPQQQQNGVVSPTAEALRVSRGKPKASRASFFSDEVGQPVLNISSLDIGRFLAATPAGTMRLV